MQRILEPELLDGLDPTHPDAVRNRRDLRLTNLIMGNFAWFRRTLPPLAAPRERALEIGAGTGELGRTLAGANLCIDGLDRWPRPANWPPGAAWHRTDIRDFDRWSDYAIVYGNLIFHQFSEDELARLGRNLQSARVIVANEPVRRRRSQFLYATIGPLLGANRVTLHDARVSIAAGFLGNDLPRALGLHPANWDVKVRTHPIGAYRMVAIRRP